MRGAKESFISAASLVVFAFLDLLDWALCFFYRFLDSVLEEDPIPCYCRSRAGGRGTEQGITGDNGSDGEVSETLFERRNLFREMGFLAAKGSCERNGTLFLDSELEKNPVPCYYRSRADKRKTEQGIAGDNGGNGRVSGTLFDRRNLFTEMGFLPRKGSNEQKKKKGGRSPRWSDCGCELCCSWQWQGKGIQSLHLVVREPIQATISQDDNKDHIENVLCLHGFLSSSSMWVETIFPNLSQDAKLKTRLFAIDLLGFGSSPKPADCLYTINNHLEMIEGSVIKHYCLDSFHVVAHSMGCIIALALAAKHPSLVKSITLVAPPYFSSVESEGSKKALEKLAERKIWPPLLFGSSVMSWYEHLGRTVCFVVCRNHSTWEWILKMPLVLHHI